MYGIHPVYSSYPKSFEFTRFTVAESSPGRDDLRSVRHTTTLLESGWGATTVVAYATGRPRPHCYTEGRDGLTVVVYDNRSSLLPGLMRQDPRRLHQWSSLERRLGGRTTLTSRAGGRTSRDSSIPGLSFPMRVSLGIAASPYQPGMGYI